MFFLSREVTLTFTIGKMIAAGQMWTGILVAIGILFLSMAITMFVREEPPRKISERLDWEPFGRLIVMTLVFAVVILCLGETVKGIGKLLAGINSVPTLLAVMGGTGLLAMVSAVVVTLPSPGGWSIGLPSSLEPTT